MNSRYLSLTLAFAALFCASSPLRAQVPEGGPYRNEEVQVDPVVLELVSQREVFLNITRVRGRTGQALKRITRSQDAIHVAEYTFHFEERFSLVKISPPAPGYRFTVQVSFGPTGQIEVGEVGPIEVDDTPPPGPPGPPVDPEKIPPPPVQAF